MHRGAAHINWRSSNLYRKWRSHLSFWLSMWPLRVLLFSLSLSMHHYCHSTLLFSFLLRQIKFEGVHTIEGDAGLSLLAAIKSSIAGIAIMNLRYAHTHAYLISFYIYNDYCLTFILHFLHIIIYTYMHMFPYVCMCVWICISVNRIPLKWTLLIAMTFLATI